MLSSPCTHINMHTHIHTLPHFELKLDKLCVLPQVGVPLSVCVHAHCWLNDCSTSCNDYMRCVCVCVCLRGCVHVQGLCVFVHFVSHTQTLWYSHAFCMALWESRMGLQQQDDSQAGIGIWPQALVTVVSGTQLGLTQDGSPLRHKSKSFLRVLESQNGWCEG